MEWSIEYLEGEELIYVRTKGVLTAEAANVMVKEIADAAILHCCNNQIVDHRETKFALNVLEYYERPEINSKLGMSHSWKIAMVFCKLTTDTHFMETIFRNRGYNFRQFNDIEKARNWVLGNKNEGF